MKVCIVIDGCPENLPLANVQFAAARAAQQMDGRVTSAYTLSPPPKLTVFDRFLVWIGFSSPELVTEILP